VWFNNGHILVISLKSNKIVHQLFLQPCCSIRILELLKAEYSKLLGKFQEQYHLLKDLIRASPWCRDPRNCRFVECTEKIIQLSKSIFRYHKMPFGTFF
jgi:hypothetical protein